MTYFQFAPNSTKYPKYPFQIKRILLSQDPKMRSMTGKCVCVCVFVFHNFAPSLGDSFGLKVVGGREIPGTNMIGAYIQKIHPSLSMNGEIREGLLAISLLN